MTENIAATPAMREMAANRYFYAVSVYITVYLDMFVCANEQQAKDTKRVHL